MNSITVRVSEPGVLRVTVGPFDPFAVLDGRSDLILDGTNVSLADALQAPRKPLPVEDVVETQAVWREAIAITVGLRRCRALQMQVNSPCAELNIDVGAIVGMLRESRWQMVNHFNDDDVTVLPRPDDVVLSKLPKVGTTARFSLRRYCGLPQIASASYVDARARADRFARLHELNVWYTEDNRTFDYISQFRRPPPSRITVAAAATAATARPDSARRHATCSRR